MWNISRYYWPSLHTLTESGQLFFLLFLNTKLYWILLEIYSKFYNYPKIWITSFLFRVLWHSVIYLNILVILVLEVTCPAYQDLYLSWPLCLLSPTWNKISVSTCKKTRMSSQSSFFLQIDTWIYPRLYILTFTPLCSRNKINAKVCSKHFFRISFW